MAGGVAIWELLLCREDAGEDTCGVVGGIDITGDGSTWCKRQDCRDVSFLRVVGKIMWVLRTPNFMAMVRLITTRAHLCAIDNAKRKTKARRAFRASTYSFETENHKQGVVLQFVALLRHGSKNHQ